MPSTVRVTCSSVTLMSVLPLRSRGRCDTERAVGCDPLVERGDFVCRQPQVPAWTDATPRPRRCTAHSIGHQVPELRFPSEPAPNDWPSSAASISQSPSNFGGAGAVGMRASRLRLRCGSETDICADQFRRSAPSMAETSMSPPGKGCICQSSLHFAFALRKIRREPFQRLFGETTIGRDLAAIDRQ